MIKQNKQVSLWNYIWKEFSNISCQYFVSSITVLSCNKPLPGALARPCEVLIKPFCQSVCRHELNNRRTNFPVQWSKCFRTTPILVKLGQKKALHEHLYAFMNSSQGYRVKILSAQKRLEQNCVEKLNTTFVPSTFLYECYSFRDNVIWLTLCVHFRTCRLDTST